MPERVERCDAGAIRKIEETPEGYLKIPASLTRVGVQEYKRQDGTIYRELRLPEEVGKEESLNSLKLAVVTDLHHGLVTKDNVRQLQRGIVDHDVKMDGSHVSAHVIVMDGELITLIKERKRRELSPGYTCTVEHNPGEWQGQKYDGIQRDIVYNHLAVGPSGWARGGPTVRLHLDGSHLDRVNAALEQSGKTLDDLAKHLRLDSEELTYKLEGWETTDPKFLADVDAYLSPPTETKKMPLKTLKLDGLTVEVEEATAVTVEKAFAQLQGKHDAQQARADGLQAKLDHATDPATIAAAVAARTGLEAAARKVLGTETKFDSKQTDKDIKIAVIKKAVPTFDANGKSDDYINARFDATIELAPNPLVTAATATVAVVNQDGGEDIVEKAAKAAKERTANAWKPKA